MATTTRIGRPRRLPRGATGDPSAEIMAAASALFGERGVAGTTMSRVAAAAGLQQSSLYYYFRSKEDVLAAILREANVIPLELISRVRAQTAAAAVRLHRFVAGDVAALCALPFDINEVHRYATRDRIASPRTGRSVARCATNWPVSCAREWQPGSCARSTPGWLR